MNTSLSTLPIATSKSNCDRRILQTRQQKARYNDKYRVRRADIKAIALRECKCADTAEMKRRLKILGVKLDLRLTSAWIAIVWELQNDLLALAEKRLDIEDFSEEKKACPIKVGDRVFWKNAPAYIESWGALQVLAIRGDLADLELIERLVPLSELAIA
jgi:hypothetical protein